jgi:predicted aconitase
VELTPEEEAILGGAKGDAARRALQYQIEVGKFWGAKRFVPVTNVHMMGDIEVMGDAGLIFAGIPITEGWDRPPGELIRNGVRVRVDPARKLIEVL